MSRDFLVVYKDGLIRIGLPLLKAFLCQKSGNRMRELDIPHYVTSDYFYVGVSGLSIVLYVPFSGEDILLLN